MVCTIPINMQTIKEQKNDAVAVLMTMTLPETVQKDLRKEIRATDIRNVPGILERAEEIQVEFRAEIKIKYADLITESRKAFLQDSLYAVQIAEDARALMDHRRTRDDPDAVHTDAVKLYRQGADRGEIMRTLSVGDETYKGWNLDDAHETHENAPRTPVKRWEVFPEPRPVSVRYVAPTKPLVPEVAKVEVPKFVCPPDHKHGINSTCYYRHKCRCDDCRNQMSIRKRATDMKI